MVIREVPAIGRWALIFGLVLPFFGYALLANYNPMQSFLWNAQTQHIVLPFFHGQNPVSCLADSIRKVLATSFGWGHKAEPGCLYNTVIPFSSVLLTSLGCLLVAAYFYIGKTELPNLWPTQFSPTEDEEQTSAPEQKPTKQHPKKKQNITYDGPIPPQDGGF